MVTASVRFLTNNLVADLTCKNADLKANLESIGILTPLSVMRLDNARLLQIELTPNDDVGELTQTKLIPFYFGLAFAFLGFMFYAEIFGNMSMGMLGNGHGFIAVIIWIAVLIMYAGLLLAKITHIIVKAIQRRNVK